MSNLQLGIQQVHWETEGFASNLHGYTYLQKTKKGIFSGGIPWVKKNEYDQTLSELTPAVLFSNPGVGTPPFLGRILDLEKMGVGLRHFKN